MSTTSAPTRAASRPTTKQRWGLGIAALLSLIALRRESRRARTASTAPEPGRESKGPRHR